MADAFMGIQPSAPGAPPPAYTPQQLRRQERRQELLDVTNLMEAVMAAKFESLRMQPQEERAPQE